MKKYLLILAVSLSPVLAVAQDISSVITSIGGWVTDLVWILLTLALVVFFWGIVRYIWSEGAGKAQGREIMFWGVIALFVMVSIWGLTNFIGLTFGVGSGGEGQAPKVAN